MTTEEIDKLIAFNERLRDMVLYSALGVAEKVEATVAALGELKRLREAGKVMAATLRIIKYDNGDGWCESLDEMGTNRAMFDLVSALASPVPASEGEK